MGYYRSRRFRSNNKFKQYQKALEHIRESHELSKELGGSDLDVLDFFYSLSSAELNRFFDEYENKHGKKAREYAEKTSSKWKSGEVQISGMVKERLFNLLPPIMPLETKYKLIENLWIHFGPSSSKTFYIGIDVNNEELIQKIKYHVDYIVHNYKIPKALENRFHWLSQGDAIVKQQILNYFLQQEKQLLIETLKIRLPILINHLNNTTGNITTYTFELLKVGKHEVKIVFNKEINGISDSMPDNSSKSINYSWILWMIGIIIILLLLIKQF